MMTIHQDCGVGSRWKAGRLLAVSALASLLTLAFPHAVLAQPAPVNLGTLPCCEYGTLALAVNAHGQVVGESWRSLDVLGKAFSWTEAGGMVDLGTLGGAFSRALAVNENGQVVGWASLEDGAEHAFSWTHSGGMVDLGTLGGTSSAAIAVNVNGQVVGGSAIAGVNWNHAFSWTQAGGMVDLGTLGGNTSLAAAVNAIGQVIGSSAIKGNGPIHAFLWTQNGGMVDLGTLGGSYSHAVAVNANGQVVGYSAIAGDVAEHAFSWTAAGGMVDLGTLGGKFSHAAALNDSGQVVGSSWTAGNSARHAFSWSQASGMLDLDGLDGSGIFSDALAVNAIGQVIGSTWTGGPPAAYAFSWTDTGGKVRLGSLEGMVYNAALAVNDEGEVVGYNLAGIAGYRATLWNVPVVAAISVSPSSGMGVTQTFTLRYGDSSGGGNLTSARVRIAATNVGPGTCTASYNAVASVISILDDSGTNWTSGALGSGTLSNGQCTLNLASSGRIIDGVNLTLTLDVTFKPEFTGLKNVYMLALSADGSNTGWVRRGTWTPAPVGGPAVTAISVSPSAGTGISQAFTLRYSDSLGALDLSSARVRFATSHTQGSGTCTAWYDAAAETIKLMNDGGVWGPPVSLGSGTLSNSQCTLHLASSTATHIGSDLTLVLHITFAVSFAGQKNIYMLATSNTPGNLNTGWLPKGTWTPHLGGPVVVNPISVTPNGGSGSMQAFTLQYSDSLGASDLSSARIRFGAANVAPGTCSIWYDATASGIKLMDDAGMWGAPVALGSGTLSNSQCTLNLAMSNAFPNGTTLTLVLEIAFSASFAGQKNIFMLAGGVGGVSSGWLTKGRGPFRTEGS